MIKAQSVANAPTLVGLFLLLPTLADLALAEPQTAAERDWVPQDRMTTAERAELPWYCSGGYREPPPTGDVNSDLVRAMADSAQYVVDEYTNLTGNVNIEQGYRRIQSPHMTLDANRQIATVDGPVLLRDQGLLMTGDHATSNLLDGTGVVDNATFLLHIPRLRGRADQIERKESTALLITNGNFTRCDPGSNVWSIHGGTINLEPQTGFGTARNVTFKLRGIPVGYLPYIKFPIDDERHTGFLMPSIGYDGDGGTDLAAPYYFNLAPSYDATYEPRSLWKRGLVHSVQFRFLAGSSANEINAAYLHKDNIYDDRDLVDNTSPGTDTSLLNLPPFEKKNRWLLNLRHNGGWSSRWKSAISYSAVSDTDYLGDIGGDVGSATVDKYVNQVGETLGNRRSAALDRKGEIRYRGDNWNYALIAQGFQNLDDTAAEQYELLPRLGADYRTSLGPADLNVDFEYTYFDKDTEGISGPLAIVGQRGVVDASMSVRKSTPWGYLKPQVDLIYRKYQLENTPLTVAPSPAVTIPRFSLDAGLYFDRFFEFRRHKLQQSLEPRIFYLHVPAENQDDLPQFDAGRLTAGFAQLFRTNRYNGRDRIGDARQVSLGITTRFLDEDSGRQFFEASIGQIYYLRDREVLFRPTAVDDPTAPRSPLFSQARLSLSNGLDISGSFEWEPDVDRSNRGNFSLKYVSGERKIFNLSYIYTSPAVQPVGQFQSAEESDLSFIWPVKGGWSAIGRWNFSWNLDQTIESIVGIEYNDCCWKSRLVFRRFLKEPRNIIVYVDDPASPDGFSGVPQTILPVDRGIFFEFQFKGLATLGRRLDLLLEQAIAGYRNREEKIGN